MRLAERVEHIAGPGVETWAVHARALGYRAEGRDVIVLSVGDPDFDTPPAIIDAAVASMRAGNTHYTSLAGDPKLRAAIAAFHERHHGRAVDPDQIVVFPGAQAAMFAAAQVLLNPGDEVIVPEPAYVTYGGLIGAAGARMVTVPLDRARGFALDAAAIARAITPSTRAVILNTPNNPTGSVYERTDLEKVARLCVEHDLWCIADEVYATLIHGDAAHVSPATLPGMAERTIVVSSLSKSHAMTGWRLGWAVPPPAVTGPMSLLILCMLFGSPGFVQDAALTALTEEAGTAERMRAAYKDRCDHVVGALAQVPGLDCLAPAGGMFVMVDVRDTGLTATEFADRLLEAEMVSVLPTDGFGASGAGHVRLGLTYDVDRLDEACARIGRFCRGLNTRAAE